jgi:uncharacterized protein YndB with AHSA1/START domain
MSEKKPARTLELHVDADAPLEAAWKAITEGPGLANWFAPIGSVSGPGAGATVTTGWSPEMTMSVKVDAWEPMKRVRWLDESGWTGPGTALTVEFQLSTEQGKTRIRFVQSGFGESEAWDDLFAGTETGWTYFLLNLREYLQRHQGRTRVMISDRLESPRPRAAMWTHATTRAGGFVQADAPPRAGDTVALRFDDAAPLEAVTELAIERKGVAFRIPGLDDALLFMEFEGGKDAFHVGYWLSVYDAAKARSIEDAAHRCFRRLHAPGA